MAAALLLSGCQAQPGAEPGDDAAMQKVSYKNPAQRNRTGEFSFCELIEQAIETSYCDDLKATEVRRGAAAFNVPDPMTRNRSHAIKLVIDRRTPAEIAKIDSPSAAVEPASNSTVDAPRPTTDDSSEAIVDATPQQMIDPLDGRTEIFFPKAGRFMSADLTGKGFAIKAISARSQEIPPGDQSIWEWEVTPTESGRHALTLRTIVEGEAGGKRYPLGSTQTIKTVEVEVSWWGQLSDVLDGIPAWIRKLTLIATALAALAIAIWQLSRACAGRSADADGVDAQ